MENTKSPPGMTGLKLRYESLSGANLLGEVASPQVSGARIVPALCLQKKKPCCLVQGFYVSGVRLWGNPLNLSSLDRLQNLQYLRDKQG